MRGRCRVRYLWCTRQVQARRKNTRTMVPAGAEEPRRGEAGGIRRRQAATACGAQACGGGGGSAGMVTPRPAVHSGRRVVAETRRHCGSAPSGNGEVRRSEACVR